MLALAVHILKAAGKKNKKQYLQSAEKQSAVKQGMPAHSLEWVAYGIIWGIGESVIKIVKDKISEGNICHAKKFEFYCWGST